MTATELAAAVNEAGDEMGVVLSYDRSAVAHWLAGVVPRKVTARLVTEVFSRRLRRKVTEKDAGFIPVQRQDSDTPAPRVHDLNETLLSLAGRPPRGSPADRSVPENMVYQRDLPVPDLSGPGVLEDGEEGRAARQGRIEKFEVEAVEALAVVFHDADNAFGGGHGRRALAAYLAADLAPKLYRPATPGLRRRLVSTAAQLIYLCGFMHFDDRLQGAAQRYYHIALILAAENNSPLDYAITLRGMSVQASQLGHRRRALDFAEAAAFTVTGPTLHRAFVHGQLAVACALDHRRADALRALSTAERLLERSGPVQAITGCYHQGALLRQEAAVREALGDPEGAMKALKASTRHRPAAERRSGAIVLADLAILRLRTGRVAEGVESAYQFLENYPYLSSGRADRALTELRALLRPHARQPAVRALLRASRSSSYRSNNDDRGAQH
jgi:tetratricopeptide (TPR) repeat protein